MTARPDSSVVDACLPMRGPLNQNELYPSRSAPVVVRFSNLGRDIAIVFLAFVSTAVGVPGGTGGMQLL